MHLHCPDKEVSFINKASHVINITITNTTIESKTLSFGWGFKLDNERISLRIENCFIRSSWIYIFLSQPAVIRNCTFHGDARTDNTASLEVMSRNKREDEYGLIDCGSSNITMRNVVVRDNVGRRILGFYTCNVQIADSRFTNNNSTSVIESHHSKLKIENSHFLNNTNKWGVIVLNINSKAHVINSTFTENKGEAGGMYLYDSEAHVVNSTFTGNKGEKAGGIYVLLRLRVQNRRTKWNFPLNFRTMRKLSELYSGIFQTQLSG